MSDLTLSLADMIKKDKPVKQEGGLAGNRGGKSNRGRGGKAQQGGRPRYNDNRAAGRNDLFRARKGANTIQKGQRGGDKPSRRGGQ